MVATFRFDGQKIPFEEGDTLASAMHRSGVRAISRSMKYHRPRGIYCNVGSCASCFVAVDGVPNVPACMTAAADVEVDSQNTMGSAKRDLLSVTDKVYRKGFDPHAAFTTPRLLNAAFMKAVRFMSGIGTVPEHVLQGQVPEYHEHEVDHLIVGAGQSGLEAARAGKGRVMLVDELLTAGGTMAWQDEPATLAAFDAVSASHVDVWLGAVAFGYYDGLVAVTKNGNLHVVRAKQITLATGAHDAWPMFPNNDLPGVLSLRGAQRLLAQGALPGARIVAHGAALPEHFVRALDGAGAQIIATGNVQAAKGSTEVDKAQIDDVWHRCDAIICNVPGTPRIELFQQAGCKLAFQNGVLAPVVDGNGTTTVEHITWARGANA